jgi:hypothetical protein
MIKTKDKMENKKGVENFVFYNCGGCKMAPHEVIALDTSYKQQP